MHVVCPHCAATNRLPAGKPAGQANCGACHAPLFTGHATAVNGTAFGKHRSKNGIPLLVDVWAPWCGPCRMMAPMFDAAAAELEPQVRLLKLNADQEPDIVGEFGIAGIPALLLLRGGRLVAQTAGAMDTRRIVAWTRGQLAQAA